MFAKREKKSCANKILEKKDFSRGKRTLNRREISASSSILRSEPWLNSGILSDLTVVSWSITLFAGDICDFKVERTGLLSLETQVRERIQGFYVLQVC